MHLQHADTETFLKSFEELLDTLTEFNAENWHAPVNYVTINSTDDIHIIFKHDHEVKA